MSALNQHHSLTPTTDVLLAAPTGMPIKKNVSVAQPLTFTIKQVETVFAPLVFLKLTPRLVLPVNYPTTGMMSPKLANHALNSPIGIPTLSNANAAPKDSLMIPKNLNVSAQQALLTTPLIRNVLLVILQPSGMLPVKNVLHAVKVKLETNQEFVSVLKICHSPTTENVLLAPKTNPYGTVKLALHAQPTPTTTLHPKLAPFVPKD